jgi:hypothetical protein
LKESIKPEVMAETTFWRTSDLVWMLAKCDVSIYRSLALSCKMVNSLLSVEQRVAEAQQLFSRSYVEGYFLCGARYLSMYPKAFVVGEHVYDVTNSQAPHLLIGAPSVTHHKRFVSDDLLLPITLTVPLQVNGKTEPTLIYFFHLYRALPNGLLHGDCFYRADVRITVTPYQMGKRQGREKTFVRVQNSERYQSDEPDQRIDAEEFTRFKAQVRADESLVGWTDYVGDIQHGEHCEMFETTSIQCTYVQGMRQGDARKIIRAWSTPDTYTANISYLNDNVDASKHHICVDEQYRLVAERLPQDKEGCFKYRFYHENPNRSIFIEALHDQSGEVSSSYYHANGDLALQRKRLEDGTIMHCAYSNIGAHNIPNVTERMSRCFLICNGRLNGQCWAYRDTMAISAIFNDGCFDGLVEVFQGDMVLLQEKLRSNSYGDFRDTLKYCHEGYLMQFFSSLRRLSLQGINIEVTREIFDSFGLKSWLGESEFVQGYNMFGCVISLPEPVMEFIIDYEPHARALKEPSQVDDEKEWHDQADGADGCQREEPDRHK